MNIRDWWDQSTLKIMWLSNAECQSSGYANQTGIWTKALKKPWDNVVVAAYRGVDEGGRIRRNRDGVLELPRARDPYLHDVIETHMTVFQSDIVWTLFDVFVLKPDIFGHLPWAAWNPIDSTPVPPHEIPQLQSCRWPIAMSQHAKREMENIGLKPIYVPHAIETDIYKPLPDRKAGRKAIEFLTRTSIPDDTFLVMAVAANAIGFPSRKNFASMFRAFAAFHEQHPNSVFYVHTNCDEGQGGEPLMGMAAQHGIADCVLFPAVWNYIVDWLNDKPVDENLTSLGTKMTLNEIYNAADVYLLLSRGEGWGIPTVEAQAAGTPVIVTDFAASAELCFGGWKVGGHLEENYPMTFQLWADIDESVACLNAAYDLWAAGNMQEKRDLARKGALDFDINRVMDEFMLPALQTIEHELKHGIDRSPLRQKKIPQAPTVPIRPVAQRLTPEVDYKPRPNWKERVQK